MAALLIALALVAPAAAIAPAQTAASPCPLRVGWSREKPVETAGGTKAAVNRVLLRAGKIHWNYTQVNDWLLTRYVTRGAGESPRPKLVVHAADASCEFLDRVTATIDAGAPCKPDLCQVSMADPPPYVAPPRPPRVGPLPPQPRNDWVTDSDYPAEALRQHMRGLTRFRLSVDMQGVVTDCQVTESSGYVLLDTTACALARRRARFFPALNAANEPIAGSFDSKMTWVNGLEDYVSHASWIVITRFRVSPFGMVSDCRTEQLGSPPQRGSSCPLRSFSNLMGSGKRPLWFEIRESHIVDGAPLAAAETPGGTVLFRRSVRYDIDSEGEITDCDLVQQRGAQVLGEQEFARCKPHLIYPRSVPGLARRGATLTIVETRQAAGSE